MNRRSILSMLGLAPLLAMCTHKDEVRTPLDGLMKEGKRPWWEAGVDLAAPEGDMTRVWFVTWGDGAVSYLDQPLTHEQWQWAERAVSRPVPTVDEVRKGNALLDGLMSGSIKA